MVEDHVSGTQNDETTPGGVIELVGSLLKYDPDDEEQGVFLLAPDGSETKLGPAIRNKPSTLIIAVPDNLPGGEFELEVRSIVRCTATLRRDRFATSLTVS